MPRDNGHLSNISKEEAHEIRQKDPIAAKYLKRLIGSTELINSTERYCLWLEHAEIQDLSQSKVLREKIEAVRNMRLSSNAASTRAAASTSHLFVQRAQPQSRYIAVPRVSSESRVYVPMDFFSPDVVASDALLTIPDADSFVFGLISSSAFNVWNRAVSGRLKSDCRISQEITYNNFPVPIANEKHRDAIIRSADLILAARRAHPKASLADLYRPGFSPQDLARAHQTNDHAVLSLLNIRSDASEIEILDGLFLRYAELANLGTLV
jgi:hypothetical protein